MKHINRGGGDNMGYERGDARGVRVVVDDRVLAVEACTWLRRAEQDGRWDDWYAAPLHLVQLIQHVPGVKALRDGTPIVHRSHLPLIAAARPDLIVQDGSEDKSWMQLPWSTWKDPAQTILPFSAVDACRRAFTPRAYQMSGARFIRGRHATLLADTMRMGKTLTSLLAYDINSGPLVVTGPLNVRSVWKRLFKALWPNIEPAMLSGRTYDVHATRKSPLVYIHYDILPTWQTFGWDRLGMFVLDEAHLLASRSRSLRTQAAHLLALRAGTCVAVTGTPLWNQPAGLFGILNAICPSAFGKWIEFARRYCSARKGLYGVQVGEPSNVAEFKARMSEIMIRRTWEDVREELPMTERSIKVLHLTPDMERQVNMLTNILRDHDVSQDSIIGNLARLRRILGEIKVEFAAEVIRPWLGKPFVVWCWHRDVADKVQEQLAPYTKTYLVHGKMNAAKREDVLDAWRDDAAGALIITISVGQVGIDLAHASREVFVELDWSPSVIAQAEMRIFSPERSMEVVYLAVQHRVDEEITTALKAKFASSEIMGIPAADAAIQVLGEAFGMEDEGDLERLRCALMETDE